MTPASGPDREAPDATGPGDDAATQAIEQELNAYVEVAAMDLLNSDQEVTGEDVQGWAGKVDVTMRTRCARSLVGRTVSGERARS
jgi:hypothetical protein